MTSRHLALPALLAFTLPALAETAQNPDFKADRLDYDVTTGEARGIGRATLDYQGAHLTADEIGYNSRTKTATAKGNVRMTRGKQRLLAEQVIYRLEDNHLKVRGLRLGDYPLYLQAEEVEGDEFRMVATGAKVSYYEPSLLSPSLSAEKLTYVPGKTLEAERARVGVGPVLPIPIARYKQDINAPFLSYLEGTAGYRSHLGVYADLSVQAPVWPGWAVGADVGLFSKRGVLVGPSGRYRLPTSTGQARGRFRTGYIYDFGDRFTDTLGAEIGANRGLASWQHLQTVGDHLTLRANLNYWSDSEMTRDFRSREFYALQQPDSYLEADYTTPNAVWSLFARPQPNSFFQAQERLPELRVDGLPTLLTHGIYQRYHGSIAVLRERALAGAPELRSQRFDAYYGLERPTTWRQALTFSPVAGARITHYANAENGKSTYTRTHGELGFDAALKLSSVSNYQNKAWKIDGLRHLLTPKVSYRYIPEAERGQAYLPPIDDEVFLTYLEPLGLGEGRQVDRIRKTNTVRLGLDNTWQTKHPEYGSRDLLRLNFAADVAVNPSANEERHSDLHTEVELTPASWLSFHAYQRLDPESATLRELNTGFTLMDGEYWRLGLSSHYLQNQIEEYVMEASYRANEIYRFGVRLHYDQRTSRFVEENFGVTHNVDNLWRLRYGVSVYNGSRRESRLGFTLSVELKGF